MADEVIYECIRKQILTEIVNFRFTLLIKRYFTDKITKLSLPTVPSFRVCETL